MPHHQHHNVEHDVQVSQSLQAKTGSSAMPVISEDELFAEPDEPPELLHPHDTPSDRVFTKNHPFMIRRESLLTRALSTDESHDEHPMPDSYFGHLPSVSSTASNFSGRSTGDFTSDDGRHSPSTRASTPSSPHSTARLPKILNAGMTRRVSSPLHLDSDASRKSSAGNPSESAIEAQLGRKRCIAFACGAKDTTVAKKEADQPKAEPVAPQPKRPCSIKFVCPFTAKKEAGNNEFQRTSRHLSPAPLSLKSETPSRGLNRRHRDSDTTIKNESPKTSKPATATPLTSRRLRRLSNNSDLARSDACRFHEFGSSEEDVEEWTRESTCHMSRLTVSDTLKKENDIRKLAEEADEEEALDEANEIGDPSDDEVSDDDDDDEVSDEGFKTDDEDGFGSSDEDDDDSDSDYEWWAPRKSRAASPFIGSEAFRPVVQRRFSDSSAATSDDENDQQRPRAHRGRKRHANRSPVPIHVRPGTPELPDSTDFVCGTLDEDRPLEQAYISCIQQRKAAKQRNCPQDIDPSFPESDPEIENDDEVMEDEQGETSERNTLKRGADEPRGRKLSPAPAPRPSPRHSPAKRLRSPPPPSTKKVQIHRSPAPRALFNTPSPRRMRSPAPKTKYSSPPPSPRGSLEHPARPTAIKIPFLGENNGDVTHTASLPRSPHPLARLKLNAPAECQPRVYEDSEDEGEATEHAKPYARGAVDIAQGLERKRLKRREKFYKHYLKKEEKKKSRRPQPGRGAERMRQVGLECMTLKGKRMLSV